MNQFSEGGLFRDFHHYCLAAVDQRLVRILQNEYAFWQDTGDRHDYDTALAEAKSRGWHVSQDTSIGLLTITTPDDMEFTCDVTGEEINR